MYSSNAIKNLGKRLRDGNVQPNDLDMLDSYREQFDSLLIETAHQVSDELRSAGIVHLLSGRTKRTKSIIRKLVRERNTGMDLSRVADIVGLRVILRDMKDQQSANDILASRLPLLRDPLDYRERVTGYRAIHLIAGTSTARVEVQLRTCAQHYWADESERMGEQAKEGNTTAEEAAYLESLAAYCWKVDHDPGYSPASSTDRFDTGYGRIHDQFSKVNLASFRERVESFVVVYHVATNALIRCDPFLGSERQSALEHFRYLSRTLDESAYDILVLNAGIKDAITVTHPRYFPEQTL